MSFWVINAEGLKIRGDFDNEFLQDRWRSFKKGEFAMIKTNSRGLLGS